jgi:NitT/TauT family transport system permease protein
LAVAVVFALWEVLSLALDAPFLPRPGIALEKFFSGFQDGILSRHAGASLLRILASLALAGPPAWAAGLLAGRIALADALASPLVYLFHPLPKVAFLPLLMLIFGLGDASKIALMGLVIFGQLFVGARDSAKAITPSLIDTVKSLGGGKGATLRHAILPATLPALISSLRISLGTAIAVLFLSETFASINGLGWYIMDSWSRVDYPDMYASIMALSALGLGLYIALDAAQAILLRWRET